MLGPDSMDCREFLSDARDYCERRLPSERIEALRAHEAACAACGALMATARETTCREVAEFLAEYVDAVLAPDRLAVFERHLRICSECVAYLESYRAAVRLGADAMRCVRDDAAPPPDGLVRAVMAARRANPPR